MAPIWPAGAAAVWGTLGGSRLDTYKTFRPFYVRFPPIWLPFGPLGLQWQPFGAPWVYQGWGPIKFPDRFMLDFPPYGSHLAQLRWLVYVAGWFALLVGLHSWLVCVAGWFALLVGFLHWLVCIAGWFALLVGLRSWLVCFAGSFSLRVERERMGGRGVGVTGWLLKTRTHQRSSGGKNNQQIDAKKYEN